MNENKYYELATSSNFTNISTWVRYKAKHSSDFIKNLIGVENYASFDVKFKSRQSNLSVEDFAEMFIDELELIRFSGANPLQRSYADGILHVLVSKYEAERKIFVDKSEKHKAHAQENYQKVERYLNLLACDIEEFKPMCDQIIHDEHSYQFDRSLDLEYFKFKQDVFAKFSVISEGNNSDEDYISVVQTEKKRLINHLNNIIFSMNNANGANLTPTYTKFKFENLQREINETCRICCVEYGGANEVILLKCTHMFHTKCLQSWIEKNGSCPCCRKTAN